MKTRILVVVIVASPVHCTRGLSLRNPSQHPIQAVEPLHGITRGVCLPVHRNSGHRLVIRIPPKLNMYRCLPPGLFDERDTLSEAVVSLRTVVTFVTWLLSRTEFLSRNSFYHNNFCGRPFSEVWTARQSCRVVYLIQARLIQRIVRSFCTVSCPSCVAPLELT